MKFKPLDYKIAMSGYFGIETKTVSGFAVDTIARICVQKEGSKWQATDYDTGHRINGWSGSRTKCIAAAIGKVEQHIATGDYARLRLAALKRLKKAGLI